MSKKIKIKQTRSLIGSLPKHRLTMRAIGFHRNQETLVKEDTPQLRGMLQQVRHLVHVEVETQTKPGKKTEPPKTAVEPKQPGAGKQPAKATDKPAKSKTTSKPKSAKPVQPSEESKATKTSKQTKVDKE